MKKLLKIIGISLIALMISAVAIASTFNSGEVQLLADGDMEVAGVGDWSTGQNALLTKEVGVVNDGTQILKVAYVDQPNARAFQNVLTSGETYRATGWARSDGTQLATLKYGITGVWSSTSSTNWQYFDEVFTTDSVTIFYENTGSAGYVEFDDVLVTEYIPPVKDAEVNFMAELDGDFEKVGTGDWTAVSGAVLTKEAGAVVDGSQVLRIAYGGTNDPYTRTGTAPYTVGKTYEMTGCARSDGTAIPRVFNGASGTTWAGTNSTDWQCFDLVTLSTFASALFQAQTTSASYVEFDDISVTEYTPPNKNFYDQILVDGDMENAGVSDWIQSVAGTITKETGAVYDGTQVLRIAYLSTPNPQYYQVPLTVGKTYRVTGWARGDGTASPRILDSTAAISWTGTTSSAWQYFDVTGVATGTSFILRTVTTGAGYAEFDDIFVTQL